MSDLTFQMLLQCRYTKADNEIEQLHVEQLVDDNWQVLDLNVKSPGFDIFMYAILTCQHMYFRVNAAESDIVLDSCEGLVTVGTDSHRSIESLHVDFKGMVKSGTVTENATAYIIKRMGQCPVSINLKDIADTRVTVSFESA